ncbi:protein wech-like [Saccostrea cucullata]|uniref:protein wech-like n=1 Tax=Saccostrea cuccullata TaxID=36930 RepID=UPI002ED27BE4
MYPTSRAQDAARCHVCENLEIHVRCVSCREDLCRSCVNKHFDSDLSKTHNIVSYKQRHAGKIRFSLCDIHKQVCELLCEPCWKPVCSKCITREHQSHSLREIEEIIKNKKKELQEDTSLIENKTIPNFLQSISQLETELSNFSKKYKKIHDAVQNQARCLHQAVDEMMENIKRELLQMEELHEVRLRNELMSLKNSLSIMTKNVLVNKGVLQRFDVLEILNHYSNLDKKLNPTYERIQFPLFLKKYVTEKCIREMFGRIKHPLSSSLIESGQRHFLKEARVVSTIHVENSSVLNGIACINSEEAWISECDDHVILRKNIHGDVTGSVQIHEFPEAISSNTEGELYFTCWEKRSIMRYNENGFHKIHQFNDWLPKGLYCTSLGDLLVCMKSDSNQSRVVRFKDNQITQTIQYNGNNPLFENATFVTENRNGDVCVCNSRNESRDSIVVVSKGGLLKFVYESESASATLRGIATDSACCILFIYHNDQRIHMLDKNGKFLTFINACTDDYMYWNGISIDKDNKVWLAEIYGCRVKVFKYLH